MTPHQIAALGIRLFTIWLFLSSLIGIIGYSTVLGSKADGHEIFVALSVLATGVVCFLTWFYPFAIARKLLPTSSETDLSNPVFQSWFAVGCSLIGLYTLSKAIPALVSQALLAMFTRRLPANYFQLDPDWGLTLAFNIFQLAFGLWLFFGGRGLKKLLTWARYS